MEIRSITSIYELKNYIANYSEETFINALRNEQEKHEQEDYEKVKKIWLDWLKKTQGFAKYVVYKNWVITRVPVFLLHRAKNVNNAKLFYDSRVFYYIYKRLAYPIIDDCSNTGFNYTVRNVYKNIDNYVKVWELLGDEKSKGVLLDVLKCRLTRNIDCILNIYEEENLQYFDDKIIGELNDEVFIDIGGYIGDTTEIFLNKCDSVRKIYIYEPNTENLRIAKQRLDKYFRFGININCRDVGVSNVETEVRLSKKESGSRIIHGEIQNSDSNTEVVDLVTLDNDIKEKVTFIKMDVEGEEKRVLEGAKMHIQNENPKLAICVYHHFDDLWQIPLQVNRYNPNYKMFLRHYCKINLSETVLYCIP